MDHLATISRHPLIDLAALPAARQQPEWADSALLAQVRDELTEQPALVTVDEVAALRSWLARVAEGDAHVLQAGDCAEDPAECTPGHIVRKSALIHVLADVLAMRSARPVVRVGRIAGQFAKPRSQNEELVGGHALPVYRGHMVNSPEPDAEPRTPDPKRLLSGYWAASTAMETIRGQNASAPDGRALWTSHEALLLDFEVPMVRADREGYLLSSAHWPWIGERTRQPDGAHVAVMASVTNPVACKVGPSTTVDDLLGLCARLDPRREPGRLTLITRMGAGAVAERVPPLVRAVRAAGHPVIWLCDPMHGNTIVRGDGRKTRLVDAIVTEVLGFVGAVSSAGGVPGGLHLEVTPDEATECVRDEQDLADVTTGGYTSLCDPRLNVAQAVSVVSAWPE